MNIPAGWDASIVSRQFGPFVTVDVYSSGKTLLAFSDKAPLLRDEVFRLEGYTAKDAEAVGFAAQHFIETVQAHVKP